MHYLEHDDDSLVSKRPMVHVSQMSLHEALRICSKYVVIQIVSYVATL